MASTALNLFVLGNPNSPHVLRWLEFDRAAGASVRGYTIHGIPDELAKAWRRLTRVRGPLGYALAGVRLRFAVETRGLAHAHSASGYGLMALVSGLPYVVTIYGSEVYAARERGPLFRTVVGCVLRGAERVSCTATAMKEFVVREFGVESRRVHAITIGVSSRTFYFSSQERASARASLGVADDLVITSTRRLRPQYRTNLLVEAFALLAAREARARLVLFEADHPSHTGYSPAFTAEVRQRVRDLGIEGRVLFVDGFRPAEDVRRYLLASDVVVSIPVSDQLAASVVEAVACGAGLLAPPLPAYAPLFEARLASEAEVDSAEHLAQSIERALRCDRDADEYRARARAWISAHSDAATVEEVRALYEAAAPARMTRR